MNRPSINASVTRSGESAAGRKVVQRGVTFFGVAVMCFGLLLWARLVLVTGHPRTATADPAQTERARADDEARRAEVATPKAVSPAPVAQPSKP